MLCHGVGLWPGRLLHSSNGAGASCPGLPSRPACLQKDAAGPLPFLHFTDQPLGIKGQERGKERSFTKDDTDRIAELGLSSGDPMGLQNPHDVQPVWFIFLLTLQQWECWKLSTLSSPRLPLQSLSLPTHPGQRSPLNHQHPVRATHPYSSSSWPAVRYRSLLSSTRVAPTHNSISTCSATPHWCCHYYRSWYCQEDGYY